MKPFINEYGESGYDEVNNETEFHPDLFQKDEKQDTNNEYYDLHTNLGSLTVVDRLIDPDLNIRDTTSGFWCPKGNFWLASGMMDVRLSGAKTIVDAINWIKKNANTCKPSKRQIQASHDSSPM